MAERAIFLAGFMGTGKTEVGRALARRLGRRFHDSDAEVARRAGLTIPELFAKKGSGGSSGRRSATWPRKAASSLWAEGRCWTRPPSGWRGPA
jgi:hypothetical protein